MNRFFAIAMVLALGAFRAWGQTNLAGVVAPAGNAKAAIAVSFLNLHANLNTADSAALEQKLGASLEQRLTALPGVVLLERRYAQDSVAKPVRTANYLIDGELSPPMSAGGEASVHLNIRMATGAPISVDVHGPAGDPDALAGKMAAEIQKAIGAAPVPAAWPAAQEAREFLTEGIWGYHHNRDDPALQALDSAEMLGETAPDLLAVRIPILCRIVAGDSGANIYNGGPPMEDDPTPEAKIVALKRAMADQAAYEKNKGDGQLKFLDTFHTIDGRTGELRKAIDREGVSLLVMMDRTRQTQADEVRAAMRSFMGYDPLHGKYPDDWETAIYFGDNLANSGEEEIAYYRGIMTTEPFADNGAPRLAWMTMPDNFCGRFLAEANRTPAYFKLMQDLSHDPMAGPLALIILANHAAPDEKAAACHALYQYLWDVREKPSPSPIRLTYDMEWAWKLEKARGVKVADPVLIQLTHFYLQHDSAFTGVEAQTWFPEMFPASEAPSLLADLKAYEKRDPKLDEHQYYDRMEQAFYDQFGGGPDAGPSLPPLPVTRFWYPKGAPRRLILGMGAITPAPGGLWLAGEMDGDQATQTPELGQLYRIGLDSSKPGWFVDPPAPIVALHPYMHNLATMPEGLYMISTTTDQPQKTVIDHYDPAKKQWDEGEVPGADSLFTAAGHLYFNLKGTDFQHHEGGLARYDGKTGNGALLASSLRRPAQNQLDDCAPYNVEDVFTGPGGKPCVLVNYKLYYISETPGPWQQVVPDSSLLPFHSKKQGELTLISGPYPHKPPSQTVIVIDPSKADPEVLLGPLTPRPLPNGADASKQAPLPAWTTNSRWPQPKAGIEATDFGMHGGDLFGFVAGGPKSTKLELDWFQKGAAEPVRIPLAFKMSDDAKAAVAAVIPTTVNTYDMVTEPNKSPYTLNMTVLPEGICFKSIIQGFWFVPFADIEAWLKTNASAPAAAAPALPVTQKPAVAPDAKSQTQGDTINPGTPNSFQ